MDEDQVALEAENRRIICAHMRDVIIKILSDDVASVGYELNNGVQQKDCGRPWVEYEFSGDHSLHVYWRDKP